MSTPGLSEKASLAQPADDKAVPAHLRCNCCNKPVFNAFQTPHGCRICQTCYQTLLHPTERRPCPGTTEACKDEEEEIHISQATCVPDIATRREISKLTVLCPNRDGGCKEQMKWREVDAHLEKCEYEKVTCEQCRDSILKRRLRSHLSDECRQRRVTCSLCQQSVVFSEMEKSHRNLDSATCCQKYTDYCPFCKDKSRRLNRRDFVEHLKLCPEKPNECKYSHLGCEHKARKSDLDKHYKDEVDHHLSLMDSKLRQAASTQSFAPPGAAAATPGSVVVGNSAEVDEVKRKVANIHDHFKKLQVNVANWAHTTLEFEQMADKFGGISQMRQFLKNLDDKVRQMDASSGDASVGRILESEVVCSLCHQSVVRSELNLRHLNLESVTCCPKFTDYCPFCQDRSRRLNRFSFIDHLQYCLGKKTYIVFIRKHLDFSNKMEQAIKKVKNVCKARREVAQRRVTSLFSEPFFHGMFRVRLFLNGNGSGLGTHLSVYLVLTQRNLDYTEEAPMKAEVTFRMVCNCRQRAEDAVSVVKFEPGNRRPSSRADLSVSCGDAEFVRINELHRFVSKDSLYLRVQVVLD